MKVSEAIRDPLDWMVAKCLERSYNNGRYEWDTVTGKLYAAGLSPVVFRPSTNWAQGGPIIEREGIEIRVHCTHNNVITSWVAEKDWPMDKTVGCCGPTPLISAMRCYVASKLGDEIEIPEDLLP